MKTDEQFESAKRLEEYRIKTERTAEPILLDGWEEMSTIDKINEIYMRAPQPRRRFNYWVLGQDDE